MAITSSEVDMTMSSNPCNIWAEEIVAPVSYTMLAMAEGLVILLI